MAPAAAPPELVPLWEELRGGVGTFTASGGTIGWLVTPDATVVVDTQMPDPARLFLAGLRERLEKEPALLRHGPMGVLHAIVDTIVDTYRDIEPYVTMVDDSSSGASSWIWVLPASVPRTPSIASITPCSSLTSWCNTSMPR